MSDLNSQLADFLCRALHEHGAGKVFVAPIVTFLTIEGFMGKQKKWESKSLFEIFLVILLVSTMIAWAIAKEKVKSWKAKSG